MDRLEDKERPWTRALVASSNDVLGHELWHWSLDHVIFYFEKYGIGGSMYDRDSERLALSHHKDGDLSDDRRIATHTYPKTKGLGS